MTTKKIEKRIQFHRLNILETAEKLFSEKGIRETTVDDISRAADCSKSTIYVYFKSKEEIYNFIIFDYMNQLCAAVDHCINAYTNFEQCYYNICTELTKIYDRHPLYFEGMMSNISIDEKELKESEILRKIYEVGEEINDRMILLFEKGVKENYLREEMLILPTVYTLWGSLANTILMAHQKEQYIEKRIKMNKLDFMQHSFQLLLYSIKRG